MNIDVTATQQRLCDLADRLDRNGNSSTAVHLRDLADAVAGGPSAPRWAFVDVFRAFSPDDLGENLQNSGVRWFESIRNVLVLLPLIVTWLGIWDAVRGYDSLIKEKPQLAAQSFIYLWQNGFEGHARATLSQVAIIDVVLLLGVVVLTAYVYLRQLSYGKTHDAALLRETLIEADLALAVYRQPSGISDLIQTHDVLEKMAESLTQQPDQVKQSLQQFVSQVAQTMQQAGSQITQTMQQAGSQIAQTMQQTSSQITQTLQHTTSRFESAAQEVSASARSLEQANLKMQKAVTTLSTPLDALATQAKDLGPALQETHTKLQTWVDRERENIERIAAVETLLRDLVKQLAASTTRLIEAANTFEQAANGMSAVAQPLASAQTGLINALTYEREAQTNLANLVSKATYDIDLALQQIKDSGVRLHAIAVDLTTISQVLPLLLDLIQRLEQAVQSYSSGGVKPKQQAVWPTSSWSQP